MIFRRTPQTKDEFRTEITRAINSGDLHLAKALGEKSIAAFPEDPEFYGIIANVMQGYADSWTEQDFADSLSYEMKKQELENPALKRVHARSNPEFQKVATLIRQMMACSSTLEETKIVEDITSFGRDAIYPLIDFLLNMKSVSTQIRDKIQTKKPTNDAL